MTQVVLTAKPTIAVQDQSDMTRNGRDFDLAQQPTFVNPVDRREQLTMALARKPSPP
jgi:hypothetical protein